MVTGLPLDDVRSLLKLLPRADAAAAGSAQQKAKALAASGFDIAKAGRLGEWVSAWSGRFPPRPARTVVAVFIGTHGVAGQGVSAHAPGFEQRFVEHAAAGGAPVSQICGTHDFGLKIFDLALDLPVADITAEPALDERGCAATIAFGMEAVAGGADLMCLGGLGEGGELAAAAVLSTLIGGQPAEWLEAEDPPLKNRGVEAAEKALSLHGTALRDPLEVLRRLGGREMAAIAGAILAARTEKVPVVLDGLTALSAAVILHAVSPGSVDHCLLADARGAVQAKIAAHLGIDRVLHLGLGSGDGTAGAMAAGSIRDACLLLDQTVPLPGA